jgi:hypothetical protein
MAARLPRCRTLPTGKSLEGYGSPRCNVFPALVGRANIVADASDFV